MSLGVICAGGLPSSTFGGAACACACAGTGVGSGAPQGLLSLPEEPHGSNRAELVGTAAGALTDAAAGAGCEDRLNAELNVLLLLLVIGDVTFAGVGLGGETGVELANPPKSSFANKSVGIDAATGLAAGWGGGGEAAVILDVKEKSNPFELDGAVTAGLETGAFEGKLSKKLPPLKGGGEVTCGAEGVALAGTGLVKLLKPENADEAGGAAGFGALLLGKLSPPNASARPPNASCFRGGAVDVIPPNDGSRACWG